MAVGGLGHGSIVGPPIDRPSEAAGGSVGPAAALGRTAAAVPAAFAAAGADHPLPSLSRGLPLGLQLIGKPFEESTLFQIGQVIEDAAGSFGPEKWWG